MIILRRRSIAIGLQTRWCEIRIMLERKRDRLEGEMELNCDGGIDNHGGSGNRHSQVEFGNVGGNEYHDNWGPDLRCYVFM